MSKKNKDIPQPVDTEKKETASIPETDGGDIPPPSEVETLKAQLQELNDRYLRLAAEYDNYRKRTQKEKDAIYPDAVATTVTSFLPFADNLQRALSFECKDVEFKKGVEMISTTLNDAFLSLNIQTVGTVGEVFDPNLHNAVAHEASDEYEENTIIEVYQQGYRIGDRVLRYAMVRVAN